MATQQELAVYFHDVAEAHRDDTAYWKEGAELTPRAEALIITGLWANDPHGARWHLDCERTVRITWLGDRGDVLISRFDAGVRVNRRCLPAYLAPAEFVETVERFIRQVRKNG